MKKLGHKTTTRDNKTIFFSKLKEHMVKQLIWKRSKDVKSVKRKENRRRKRTNLRMEAVSSQKCKSSSRPSKRLRRRRQSKHDDELVRRKSYRNRPSCRQNSIYPDLTSTTPLRTVDPQGVQGKPPPKKHRKSKENILMPPPIHSEHLSVKGLDNLGQTCYFNCIVQCLFHCPLFREGIENVPQSTRSIPILRELQRLFTRMARSNSSTHLSPSRCFSAAMKIPECERAEMNRHQQEDARGFFLMLVEYLRKVLKPLSELFEGELLSTLSCQRCSHSRVTSVPFKLLALSLPADSNEQYSDGIPRTHHINDLLEGFVRPEFITGFTCTECGVRDITEKKLDILSTPQILVLGLKRFKGLRKLNDFVEFPLELRLRYVSAGNEQHQRYQITGVVLHKGPSIAAGHYISIVYSEGIWLEINDSSVQEVSWEMVKKNGSISTVLSATIRLQLFLYFKPNSSWVGFYQPVNSENHLWGHGRTVNPLYLYVIVVLSLADWASTNQ